VDYAINWKQLNDMGAEYSKAHPQAFTELCETLVPEDVATILYTSGTTGRPKGVVLTHLQAYSEVSEAFPFCGARTDDTSLTFLPYAHILGRIDPVYHTRRFHQGMDFTAPVGTDIYATGNGTIVSSGWKQGYGNCVEINHGFGYLTLYGHMSKIKARIGQKVKRGDVIGLVGSTGKSTGPHLHYEVHLRGEIMNPQNYYFLDLSPAEYDKMVQMSNNSGQMFD
jgi:hypothetical protein